MYDSSVRPNAIAGDPRDRKRDARQRRHVGALVIDTGFADESESYPATICSHSGYSRRRANTGSDAHAHPGQPGANAYAHANHRATARA